MEKGDYRKLDVDLPTQPLVDTQPALIAGWVWVGLIFVLALLFYFFDKAVAR